MFFKGYLNHEPRAALDSIITFNICALLINTFTNYKDALQKEEYRKSMFKTLNASSTHFEERKKFKNKTKILFNNFKKNVKTTEYKVLINYFKSRYFNDNLKKEEIKKLQLLLSEN